MVLLRVTYGCVYFYLSNFKLFGWSVREMLELRSGLVGGSSCVILSHHVFFSSFVGQSALCLWSYSTAEPLLAIRQ